MSLPLSRHSHSVCDVDVDVDGETKTDILIVDNDVPRLVACTYTNQ